MDKTSLPTVFRMLLIGRVSMTVVTDIMLTLLINTGSLNEQKLSVPRFVGGRAHTEKSRFHLSI